MEGMVSQNVDIRPGCKFMQKKTREDFVIFA